MVNGEGKVCGFDEGRSERPIASQEAVMGSM
jgi:hypothetical protein